MDNRAKYKELRRSGTLILWNKESDTVTTEVFSLDNHAYRVTLYCGVPFVISREKLDKYVPSFDQW